jgi:hypothetical protein
MNILRVFIQGCLSILFGATEMLLDRGFGRSPQQLDVAHNVSSRPLEHLYDETLRLLVEYGQQLEDGSGVVVDEDGQVVAD